jgi:hypothetical protein
MLFRKSPRFEVRESQCSKVSKFLYSNMKFMLWREKTSSCGQPLVHNFNLDFDFIRSMYNNKLVPMLPKDSSRHFSSFSPCKSFSFIHFITNHQHDQV